MTSIKHQSIPQSPPAAYIAPAARLPDFCNLGIMLRLLLIVNLLCFAAAVVRMDARDLWQQFLFISAVAQPAIIFSLLVMCALRKPFAKLSYGQAILVILFLEAIIGTLFWWWLEIITPVAQPVSPWQYGFFFAFATGFSLLYFDLRARALSPALNEARLQALQARIRPHFLFNSINAVLSLIRAEPKRAERMLEDMSELFRVLMADNRKLTPLADEITLCKRYLEIEDIRLGERLVVIWKIDEMPAAALVPPLILQPLVENAVFHGIEPRQVPGTLTIEILPKGKQFSIRLTNPFHADSTHVTGNRMAIANIKERLQLHFDAEASLKVEVKDEIYVVTITLPVRTEDL
jgi:two-component system sensor histidine kinase AlgZ